MLQPQQLRELTRRYGAPIAELRAFFAAADVPVGTARALADVAARAETERSFHRDLTSHVWVLAATEGGQVSTTELLGIVAVAAAGEDLAAQADEGTAHELLRFVMAARQSLGGAAETQVIPARVTPPVGSRQRPALRRELLGAAALLLLACGVGGWLYARLRPADQPSSPTSGPRGSVAVAPVADGAGGHLPAVASTGGGTAAPTAEAPAAATGREFPAGAGGAASTPVQDETAGPRTATRSAGHPQELPRPKSPRQEQEARSSAAAAPQRPEASHAGGGSVGPAVTSPRQATVAPAEVPAAAGRVSVPHTATPPAPTARTSGIMVPFIARNNAPAVPPPRAVPNAMLSRLLDSPKLPDEGKDAELGYTSDGRRYPKLLRRKPAGAFTGTDAGLVAEVQPPAIAGVNAARNSAAARPVSVPAGTVRPTTLGIMAGNLLYSPTPAYPEAASAAHVQGTVRIQADVDPYGNVASARVVSGPPLLRDAALEAVQHWRYKPFMNAGKPSRIGALAVVEFELP